MKQIIIYYDTCPCKTTAQQKQLFNWFYNQTEYNISRRRVTTNPDYLAEFKKYKKPLPLVLIDGQQKGFDDLLKIAGVKDDSPKR